MSNKGVPRLLLDTYVALEYFYNQASETFATFIVDNTNYSKVSGCSDDICNDPIDHFQDQFIKGFWFYN